MRNRLPIVIIVAFALMVAAYFTATQPITPRLSLVSSLSVIVFALPSYYAVVKFLGKKNGLLLLTALGAYALIIESLAIHTGFPYGTFTYTDVLGNKIFGLTPWTVAFAYPPILLLAYRAAVTITVIGSTSHRVKSQPLNRAQKPSLVRGSTFHIALVAAFVAMVIDLVLDPAAVRLGFWYWDKPGFFYGVPLVNFLGWLLSGFLGALTLHLFVREQLSHKPLPHAFAHSGLAILWFWTAVNLWLQQWIPALLGIVMNAFLVRLLSSKQDTIKR